MNTLLEDNVINSLLNQGLIPSAEVKLSSLNGGVSCEIILVEHKRKQFVLKRALEKLKVKDDWYADVNRNKTEQQYLSYVASFLPESVPNIYYSDDELNFFCMEMLDGNFKNWKTSLLSGECKSQHAYKAGEILGKIHEHSFKNKEVESTFDTLDNFKELRIDPYFITCAKRNPKLKSLIEDEANQLALAKSCLVHGDYSPKNILISPERMVVLDCEVAWYGDPVFDLAFLMTHFFLKALHLSKLSSVYVELANVTWQAYKENTNKLIDEDFESRMVRILTILMLARVDGKSPLEYLRLSEQELVRDFAHLCLLNKKPNSLAEISALWLSAIPGEKNENH